MNDDRFKTTSLPVLSVDRSASSSSSPLLVERKQRIDQIHNDNGSSPFHLPHLLPSHLSSSYTYTHTYTYGLSLSLSLSLPLFPLIHQSHHPLFSDLEIVLAESRFRFGFLHWFHRPSLPSPDIAPPRPSGTSSFPFIQITHPSMLPCAIAILISSSAQYYYHLLLHLPHPTLIPPIQAFNSCHSYF